MCRFRVAHLWTMPPSPVSQMSSCSLRSLEETHLLTMTSCKNTHTVPTSLQKMDITGKSSDIPKAPVNPKSGNHPFILLFKHILKLCIVQIWNMHVWCKKYFTPLGVAILTFHTVLSVTQNVCNFKRDPGCDMCISKREAICSLGS